MPFFYVVPNEMSIYNKDAESQGAEFMLYDQPSRDLCTDLTWSAVTTLVGKSSSSSPWSIIGTFSWGWSMTDGDVTVTPWKTVDTPEDVNSKINAYNISKIVLNNLNLFVR